MKHELVSGINYYKCQYCEENWSTDKEATLKHEKECSFNIKDEKKLKRRELRTSIFKSKTIQELDKRLKLYFHEDLVRLNKLDLDFRLNLIILEGNYKLSYSSNDTFINLLKKYNLNYSFNAANFKELFETEKEVQRLRDLRLVYDKKWREFRNEKLDNVFERNEKTIQKKVDISMIEDQIRVLNVKLKNEKAILENMETEYIDELKKEYGFIDYRAQINALIEVPVI